jgi:hypothetical protein
VSVTEGLLDALQITGSRRRHRHPPGQAARTPGRSRSASRRSSRRNQSSQLTNFHRADTFASQSLRQDSTRVFFTASADPLGANPSNNCQLFSIDRAGGDLRQLTSFREADASLNGCTINYPKGFGCIVVFGGEDERTGNLVFLSSCDPFGSNPNGQQRRWAGQDARRSPICPVVIRPGGEISAGPGTFAFSGR